MTKSDAFPNFTIKFVIILFSITPTQDNLIYLHSLPPVAALIERGKQIKGKKKSFIFSHKTFDRKWPKFHVFPDFSFFGKRLKIFKTLLPPSFITNCELDSHEALQNQRERDLAGNEATVARQWVFTKSWITSCSSFNSLSWPKEVERCAKIENNAKGLSRCILCLQHQHSRSAW